MNNRIPTPHDIQRYRPTRLIDFVGCEQAKSVLADLIRADGDSMNTIITGDTGTGKFAMIEACLRTRNCPYSAGPLLGPCGVCADCLAFDFENEDTGCFVIGRIKTNLFGSVVTHFYNVDCCHLGAAEIRKLANDISWHGKDRSIVFLDETQDLGDGKRDRFLLTKMIKLNAIWIAAGTTTDGLSPTFVRRFACRCVTTLPTAAALASYLVQRCEAWKIAYDCPETFGLLVERSQLRTAECIAVLARAASREGRRLDKQLVMDHPFITGVTR